ncbi:DUF393 domain-containing protein [Cyanobium sp. LEGE 06143]|nr:DUF393 domain-containing protein [Cyanobium sp. LEGE 06143]
MPHWWGLFRVGGTTGDGRWPPNGSADRQHGSCLEQTVIEPASPIVLVFDGGCPFCRHFAELSELRSGIPRLEIRDGRADTALRRQLGARGYHLRDGAMVLEGSRVWHGAEAIAWICERMEPSAALLQVLAPLMADSQRSRMLYPGLLLARRLALGWRGLPVDPESEGLAESG